jgi:hypothetical protein
MADRQQEIAEAHRKTFEWIFEKTWRQNTPWSNFVEWLGFPTENGIYWINGKAGSGKSSLMRYIYNNPKTRALVRLWAAPLPSSIVAFFFWNSGTLEQRSQSGSLRSILFEVLSDRRDLIPIILPQHWAREYSYLIHSQIVDSSVDRKRPDWRLPILKDALLTLVTQESIQLKLCLFIDGLDEYDGDHEEMAEFFQNIASSANAKVCLSSRPLLVFDDAFGTYPSLRLQDLTFDDIKQYIGDRLRENPRFKRLAQD